VQKNKSDRIRALLNFIPLFK